MAMARTEVPLLWTRKRLQDEVTVSKVLSANGGCPKAKVARSSPLGIFIFMEEEEEEEEEDEEEEEEEEEQEEEEEEEEE